jgi:hypothetical protein
MLLLAMNIQRDSGETTRCAHSVDCLNSLDIDTQSIGVGKDCIVLLKWISMKPATDAICDVLREDFLGKDLAFKFNGRVSLCNLGIVEKLGG